MGAQMQDSPVNDYFFRMHYGTIPTRLAPEDVQRFGTALIAIVGADGMSERERWAYREIGRLMGAPEAALERDLETDVSKLNLAEILAGFDQQAPARALLYTAIVIASVDGYSDAERKAAARIAEMLRVPPDALTVIESLVEADLALRRARASFLFPAGRFA